MTAKTRAAAKPAVKNADTSTEQSTTTSTEQSTATSQEQSTATGTEQNTATGQKQGDGDGSTTGGDGNGDGDGQSQGSGPAATNDTAKHELVTVTLKTSFYCHGKSASFTAGDEYECDAETAERLVSNNMAKR